ncbi:alpha-amylase family glycosyl hydrolase [Ruegeria sp. 2205SS24-7]|uniref:alpha-amylase family glycosyl hydrolase n=1 Tax=Ruegeria discodermiae TaxID=3064389 RepID=UPI00274297CF|nr:alpha-amylase family glycosyl hydrolase [Ruegeria sp. 2205SS24-7]MDP5218480.1 alpha-amylase family glycosyl hydrolase [Ruegeria sp. 2205SS24-7]
MNAQMAPQPGVPVERAADWWRGGVIYQIYPRSFQDSNGDGIGDLAGITQRLDYVASLGVDAIWISPFFKSPMKDFGYDVSDYRDVDPMFGALADFDALLARAHELGLKVMIDLVLSHTSDQHPWFAESRASRDNPKSDWYVWSDPKPDGTPPNNWLAIFGGSAWQWDARRQQYYLHNFLTSQPDLNFHEPQVQDALLDVARFWLDRGVDGFRLDTINFYFHDKELRDNPPLPQDARNDSIAPQVNPYNHQDHLYSKSQPENLAFLERLRALTDAYDARACLGEVGDAHRGLKIMGQYTAGEARMHMCYAFEFLEGRRATAERIVKVFEDLEAAAPDGWACWAFSNHDVQRHASRWDLSDAALRAYTTLMMCLRGSVCLYQGEELGLAEADVAFEDLQDPYGIEFWPEFKGRDGCRTPMAWQTQAENAGFGSGKSWLPISPTHAAAAVDRQEQDPAAMLHHYRRAIALRDAHPALQSGSQNDLCADQDLLSFQRSDASETLFCAFNLGDEPAVATLPDGSWQVVSQGMQGAVSPKGRHAMLGAWQYLIVKRAEG